MIRQHCHYCRQPMKRAGARKPNSMTWDHLTPTSRGGLNVASNKVRACRKCNTEKGSMTEEEYRAFLADRTARRRAGRQGIIQCEALS